LLIDKLGDLTKFIVLSLYEGRTIDQIKELTQLGDSAIEEEISYLIRGQLLISSEDTRLTDLGKEYGQLLKKFSEMSDGIKVMLNTFTNRFEDCFEQLDSLIEIPDDHDDEIILDESFSFVLARNDNYSNSLEIAEKKLNADIDMFSPSKPKKSVFMLLPTYLIA